ncbi:polycystic kidney disease protein 1-like 2 [Branchiostoma floridae]|uniref:Polycystic kidney disease protein 1-like 2 n=1 Tax=Branchiostoma floridae TaxID=7739 RepID=A0A9J7M5R5_BRAFL|nr:polycystic kidney disease protein 1-like 2 [Branchiostoma floridae]
MTQSVRICTGELFFTLNWTDHAQACTYHRRALLSLFTQVSPASTLVYTVCLCDHLTGFGTSAGTEPNRINFRSVFKKFQDLVNNYAVWTTMVVLMGMYVFMIYPARRKDKIDEQEWSIKNVHGNRESHPYRFLVRVETGHDWGAGTRSKVAFVLNGDVGSTGPREFQQDDMTFQSGGVNTFLLTTPEPLGGLASLTVWHDNSGAGRHASWCLERVEVTDLQTNKRTQFVCNDWIGVEHGDGRLVRTLPPPAETQFVCNDWIGVEHGDGRLVRTLPPAAESDVSLGQRFGLKLREKFKDGHVWLSVVTSRPKSYFTRVQRLSCCLCLLYCKMITSAMWFPDSEQGTSNVVLTIGSIELTAETLLVSLWTTLQVFPVNFIIVQIFRRCRPKGAPKSSGRKLPHWCLYVGWALLVLTTLVSGFFLLLYSLEWGRDKSVKWLTAFGLSFLQSMVVVQPAQAIMLTFGTTILCAFRKKKSATGDKDEDVEAGKRQPVDETLPTQTQNAWSDPEETEQLKQQRDERKNWLQLTGNGKRCIVGIIIIAAAWLMVHEAWSPSAPAINQGLKTGFLNGTDSVKAHEDVLSWLEGDLARQLYPTQQYNGAALGWKDGVFINDMPAYRVGPIRLRQFRGHTGLCDVPLPALRSNQTCLSPYVSGMADDALASVPESNPANFAHVVHGTRGSYGGPGYSVELGEIKADMMEALEVLKANQWIDPFTAALVLDVTLYHANTNLVSTVSVLFEFPPTKGAITTLQVATFPLAAQGIASTILFVAKAMFVACILYVIIRLVKKARKEGRAIFLQLWTIVDVASVVTALYVIVAIAMKDASAGKAKALISQELQKEQRGFVDLSEVAFWSDQLTSAVAMVIWFNLVKICSLMRVSNRVRTYLDVLIQTRLQLLGSLAIFLLTVAGFSMLGHLLFCPYVETFRSLTAATADLAFLPWADVSYDVLATPSEVVGPLFLLTSSFTLLFMVLSFTAGVFVSATSAMMGEKGRGKVVAARQRGERRARAARENRVAAPPARNDLHYCNCDDGNECFGQTHTAETQV